MVFTYPLRSTRIATNPYGGVLTGRLTNLSRHRHAYNRRLSQETKQSQLFHQALDKIKRQTGLDYAKIIMGDERERQRLKMLEYQDAMADDDEWEE